jgi:hypothetical protein
MSGFIPWRVVDVQLKALRTIWISTTRPDGRPHSVPVWFLWEDGDQPSIIFLAHDGTQKVRNLAQRSWVIIHAGDGDDTYILEGAAERIIDHAALDRLNHLYMEKYVDPGSGAQASFGETDHIYRVQVKHVMTWLYGNIANRTDWTFS